MRISVVQYGRTQTIDHKGEVLYFDNFPFNKRANNKQDDKPTKEDMLNNKLLYSEINRYWSLLPEKEQDDIFSIYKDILEDIYEARTKSERVSSTKAHFKRLMNNHHDLERIKETLYPDGFDGIVTRDVKKDYVPGIYGDNAQDTTYLLNDYYQLVLLTIAIRVVHPVWEKLRSLIENTKVRGHKVYFEMEMTDLLIECNLFKSEAVLRLKRYVDALWEKDCDEGKLLGTIVSGMPTTRIPYYLLATSLVNKLSMKPVTNANGESDLIRSVYKRIHTEITKLNNKFSDVRAAALPAGGDDGDEKRGYLEIKRARAMVRRDAIVLNRVYAKNYRELKKRIDPDIPNSLVKSCMRALNNLNGTILRRDQIILAQWVMARTLSVRLIDDFYRQEMVAVLSVTTAALIHWKFKGLAQLLLSSSTDYTGGSDIIMTPMDELSPQIRKRLSESYQIRRRSNDNVNTKHQCPGYNAVREFSNIVTGSYYEFTHDETMAERLNLEPGEYIKPVRDLRLELAELLIKLNRV